MANTAPRSYEVAQKFGCQEHKQNEKESKFNTPSYFELQDKLSYPSLTFM